MINRYAPHQEDIHKHALLQHEVQISGELYAPAHIIPMKLAYNVQ
jgi:hypothetical protein